MPLGCLRDGCYNSLSLIVGGRADYRDAAHNTCPPKWLCNFYACQIASSSNTVVLLKPLQLNPSMLWWSSGWSMLSNSWSQGNYCKEERKWVVRGDGMYNQEISGGNVTKSGKARNCASTKQTNFKACSLHGINVWLHFWGRARQVDFCVVTGPHKPTLYAMA